jgi:hypothetical protein
LASSMRTHPWVLIHRLHHLNPQPDPRDIIKPKRSAQAYVYDSLAQRAEAWHWRRPVRRFESAKRRIFFIYFRRSRCNRRKNRPSGRGNP